MLLRIMEGHRLSYASFLHGTLTALPVERAQNTLVLADIKDCSDLRSHLIPLPQHKLRMMKVHQAADLALCSRGNFTRFSASSAICQL